MAFCSHCLAISLASCDDHGFVSCSGCGKVLAQVTIGGNSSVSITRRERIKRVSTIRSQVILSNASDNGATVTGQ